MLVIVKDILGEYIMVCKGVVEEILLICNYIEVDEKIVLFIEEICLNVKKISEILNSEGMWVIVVVYKKDRRINDIEYIVKDEIDMIFVGYIGFLDLLKLFVVVVI